MDPRLEETERGFPKDSKSASNSGDEVAMSLNIHHRLFKVCQLVVTSIWDPSLFGRPGLSTLPTRDHSVCLDLHVPHLLF